MKDFFKSAFAIGLALFGFAAVAQQPVQPLFYPLTNTTTFNILSNGFPITTAASSNINSVTFPIWRDRGFVLHVGVYSANANNAGSNVNVILQFATPHPTNWNGGGLVTNWENAQSFNFANNLATTFGGSNGFFSTLVQRTTIDNYTIGRLLSITNNSLATLFLDPTNTYITVIP